MLMKSSSVVSCLAADRCTTGISVLGRTGGEGHIWHYSGCTKGPSSSVQHGEHHIQYLSLWLGCWWSDTAVFLCCRIHLYLVFFFQSRGFGSNAKGYSHFHEIFRINVQWFWDHASEFWPNWLYTTLKSQTEPVNIRSSVCCLRSSVCCLRSSVCHLRSSVCRLRSSVCRLRSSVCCLRRVVKSTSDNCIRLALSASGPGQFARLEHWHGWTHSVLRLFETFCFRDNEGGIQPDLFSAKMFVYMCDDVVEYN